MEEEDSEEEEDNDEPPDDFNAREFQKFVQKIFPSKGGKERIQQLEKIDEMLEKKKSINKKKNKSNKKIKKTKNEKIKLKKNKKILISDSSDEEYEKALEAAMRKEEVKLLRQDLEEEEEMDDNEIQDMLKQNMKFNIIFTVGQPAEEDDETSDEEDTDEDIKEEDVEEKSNKTGKNQTVRVEHHEWDKAYNGIIKSVVELKENPAYSLYNIQLEDEGDDEEWALQENIKGKYIKAINKEEDAEEEKIMEELKQLIKTQCQRNLITWRKRMNESKQNLKKRKSKS